MSSVAAQGCLVDAANTRDSTVTSPLHGQLSHHPLTTGCHTISSQLTVLKYARDLVVVIRRHPDEPFEVLKEIQALVLKKSNARMRLSRLHTSAFWLLLIENTSFLISTLKPQQGYQVRPAHQVDGWFAPSCSCTHLKDSRSNLSASVKLPWSLHMIAKLAVPVKVMGCRFPHLYRKPLRAGLMCASASLFRP